ncbi:hypothetical protein SAMN06314019_10725 [Epsilonproteobacteria bacterium SCGC AD-311-C15]|jgi:hypothetical protein|nr:hypothetical protein SAMN06314019_10725 [Epsilonproteobacteria bacterium SCGC AD-311-C15]
MTKFIQAFLSGIFFTFFLDFFLFLGIQLNYIDFYEIDVYYNILFADHQNIFIFFGLSAIIGYLTIYYTNNKISFFIIILLFLLSFSTLIKPIGYEIGAAMLMNKNITLKENKNSFTGDIYYDGRKTIIFYDYRLQKIISLDKRNIK